jgi:zinc transporter 1/2/3
MDGFDSAANFGRKTGWWGNIFFIARHFGTGIIIATAFIVSLLIPVRIFDTLANE